MADLPVFNESGQLVVGPGEVWRYRCLHLPTGRQDEQEAGFINRHAFLACLAKWNGISPGVWQYWPADYGAAFAPQRGAEARTRATDKIRACLAALGVHEASTTTVSTPSQRPKSPEDTGGEISS